ncbi:conserved hypothetical protein [Rubrivivax sp. A210]|uniref:UPF0149 family protein n=1 Tax=Rubrivivax sp. A210 TaxID=2772301 RepID=UPI0019182ABC|nr:UPF0149 family protein [Rubrivivax sp. A210]CAD5374352.1 conserved hypothetical protein [Rubrivivax sp. A210]
MDYPRYDPQSPLTPLDAAEIDGLDRLLQNLPADGVMSLDGVDGYLSALQVGPPRLLATLATADWLPAVWGSDGEDGNEAAAPFASKRQRKATVVLLLRHLRHLGEQFTRTPEAWEPIFSIAEAGTREFADARDWCAGFLQAVDLMPEAWGGAWDDAALAPLLHLGGGLDGVDLTATEDLDDAETVDRLSRAVPEAVLLLQARRAAP